MSNHFTDRKIRYKSLAFLGYPKYRVATDGSVWSHTGKWGHGQGWRKLKPEITEAGYHRVVLAKGKERFRICIHTLVLLAFVGQKKLGQQCRHLNGIPTDNKLDNLVWGTATENNRDKARHGTQTRGEEHPEAKLTDEQVREIYQLVLIGELTHVRIGELYGVTNMVVSGIGRGVGWKHLGLLPISSELRRWEQKRQRAKEIRVDYATGEWTQKELGEKYNLTQVAISKIIRGEVSREI